MAKDPVCGMEVDEKKASFKTKHKETMYYFCAEVYMRKFQNNPEKFTKYG